MEFNKELFYSLCEKYDVELSDKYDRPMIKIDGKIEPINIELIEKIFKENIDN